MTEHTHRNTGGFFGNCPACTAARECPRCGSDTCPGRGDVINCTAIVDGRSAGEEGPDAPLDYAAQVQRMAEALHRDCELEWQAIAVVDPDRQITQHGADAHYGRAHDLVRRLWPELDAAQADEVSVLTSALHALHTTDQPRHLAAWSVPCGWGWAEPGEPSDCAHFAAAIYARLPR